jgi:hypothetical protein
MKPDSELRLSIIGLGNLLEIIWPCFKNAIDSPDLAQRVLATTLDEPELRNKKRRFGIKVQLGNNLKALQENHPDIIAFAPPPEAAPKEIDSALADYFFELRQKGASLPEIYAFPPMPPGSYYQKVLGADVLVVNLIPNNVTKIAGRPVQDEGYYVAAFHGKWPKASQKRLQRIFASQGSMVQSPPELLVPMLGGTCGFFCLWEVVPQLAAMLNEKGYALDHNQVGGFLRGQCRELNDFKLESMRKYARFGMDKDLALLLENVARAWLGGVGAYFKEIAFPFESARTILSQGFDLILHTTQCEPLEVLHNHAVGAATKGGVLEKAVAVFHEMVKPVLQKGVQTLPEVPDQAWQGELLAEVLKLCRTVGAHGKRLAG